ncbi:MAG: hypothetical protein ACLTYN_05500 [Dysosmobacter welbionis]
MEDFKAQYPDEELFRTWTRRFWRTATPSSWWIWRRRARPWRRCGLTGISDVSHYEEIAGGLSLRNVATVVCVALIAILFVVSVFIISNTIKLTTLTAEEIAIMRMVGATNGFIHWPLCMRASCWACWAR